MVAGRYACCMRRHDRRERVFQNLFFPNHHTPSDRRTSTTVAANEATVLPPHAAHTPLPHLIPSKTLIALCEPPPFILSGRLLSILLSFTSQSSAERSLGSSWMSAA